MPRTCPQPFLTARLASAGLLAIMLLVGPGASSTRAATATAPAPTDAALQQVDQLRRDGHLARALQRADDELAAQPNHAGLRFARALLLGDLGRKADAAAAFERMTEEFTELPEPYNNLAVLRVEAGQLDQARTLLETALRLDPRYRTARENLADVLLRLAQRAYEEALDPQRVEPGLQRKLRLVRELNAAVAAASPPTALPPSPMASAP